MEEPISVEVISKRIFLTLQAGEFFELEKYLKKMKTEGWSVENHPQFSSGKWKTTLSRPGTYPQNLMSV